MRVISLRDSGERRDAMRRQLDAVPGLSWAFFDACAALPDDLPYDRDGARRAVRRELTAGELGCFASHAALWRWLAVAPPGTILVALEDDLIIDPQFFAALPAVCAAVPADYVRLYAKAPVGAAVIGRAAGRHLVRYRGIAFGTQAYVMRRPAAEKLLGSIRRVVRPVDDEMDRYWAHKVPNLGLFPFPVIERTGPSTIEAARRGLAPPRWSELGWQSRRTAESLRRRWANLKLARGWPL